VIETCFFGLLGLATLGVTIGFDGALLSLSLSLSYIFQPKKEPE
jgi:hypothetical protein